MGKTLYFDLGQTAPPSIPPDPAILRREDEDLVVDGVAKVRCGACGMVYGVGDSPVCKGGHGRVPNGYGGGFAPYFDYGLGQEVTGWGDVRKAMRENHLDFRDHPTAGDTEARRDRLRERQRQESGR